mmetsp:Transcript_36620/g.32831  ORF Transcript_36620/g.32831 Transcript_36620/m.32831 type:complete len:107 (+) Transcript_36620:27-347(+)
MLYPDKERYDPKGGLFYDPNKIGKTVKPTDLKYKPDDEQLPLIRNLDPRAFIPENMILQTRASDTDDPDKKTREYQPSLNWEPVVLKKPENLKFHPEFERYQQQQQ